MTGHLSSALRNQKLSSEHVSVSVQKLWLDIVKDQNDKPGSHGVKQTGCKLHRTEPVLQLVLLHALVAIKKIQAFGTFFVISVT